MARVDQTRTLDPATGQEPPPSELVSGWKGLYSRNANALSIGIGGAAVIATLIVCLAIWGPGMQFPAAWGDVIGSEVDEWVLWLTREASWFFDGIKSVVTKVLITIEDFLLWAPWPAVVLAVAVTAWRVSGLAMAAFATVALVLVGLMGRLPGGTSTLWEGSMETLALIVVSVGISLLIGIPLGVAASRNSLADSVIRPILDGMQTMPSFVYLVPGILFFGLGNVPAVMATVIYAVPPVIRLTNLGIRQVSVEAVEAARSFGATPLQLLAKVQIPMALPTIMAGINQTTMMALAMVVVASLVGAGGLGEAVLRALGRQEAGNSAIAGLSIVVMAIIIDRITQSAARERERRFDRRLRAKARICRRQSRGRQPILQEVEAQGVKQTVNQEVYAHEAERK